MRALIILLLFTCTAQAQIRLPRLVSDGVVLQRDEPLKIWGQAAPKEKVTLTLEGKKYRTAADAAGNWSIALPPHPAGGPYTVHLKGSNELTVQNVLFGDVWLCTGQSNMVLNMERVKERYPQDIAAADYPQLRNFFIRPANDLNGPRSDLEAGNWLPASPENVLQFGAVTFFFARTLYEQYRVPIGIINSSVGGTPIEAWISEKGLKDFPALTETIQKNKDEAYIRRRLAENREHAVIRPQADKGMLETPKWFDEQYAPKGWLPYFIPGFWEDQGLNNLDGVVWFRREIEVPASMCGAEARLFMGRIVDADHVYVNGQQVGNITYQYPPRRYVVKTGVLRPGKNTIVVRVQNNGGKGGFVPDKPYYLTANGTDIDLKGEWQYKVGQAYVPVRNFPSFSAQNQPASLFNAMIAPLVSQTRLKGVLWYQGESNAGNPAPYGAWLKALIRDFRDQWQNPDLPFLYVQLANFMDRDLLPTESNWAQLRFEQMKALSEPNTAMAVTIDLGEWNDIHPLNKKDVGMRLARGARNLAYGEKDVVYSGPVFKSLEARNNALALWFDHVGGGLISIDGEPLSQFAVAGDDRKFVWANAEIDGDRVIVSAESVETPKYVRYAWSDNPFGANLYNRQGLPASPFEAHLPETDLRWHGKKAAVVLTYDDALEVHLDNVVPILDSLGFKGSFYLSAAFPGAANRLNDWKAAARNGHELGNHTLYHPCDASKPGRSWVSPENDLSKYSISEIRREVEMTNVFLASLDGKTERTFAYTCGDTETGEGSFIEAISPMFTAMRGVRGQLNRPGQTDLKNMDCYAIDSGNADQLYTLAEQAKKEGAMLVLLFHGVGGGHNLNIDLKQHNDFLKYLKAHQEDFWVTTLVDAARTINQSGK